MALNYFWKTFTLACCLASVVVFWFLLLLIFYISGDHHWEKKKTRLQEKLWRYERNIVNNAKTLWIHVCVEKKTKQRMYQVNRRDIVVVMYHHNRETLNLSNLTNGKLRKMCVACWQVTLTDCSAQLILSHVGLTYLETRLWISSIPQYLCFTSTWQYYEMSSIWYMYLTFAWFSVPNQCGSEFATGMKGLHTFAEDKGLKCNQYSIESIKVLGKFEKRTAE